MLSIDAVDGTLSTQPTYPPARDEFEMTDANRCWCSSWGVLPSTPAGLCSLLKTPEDEPQPPHAIPNPPFEPTGGADTSLPYPRGRRQGGRGRGRKSEEKTKRDTLPITRRGVCLRPSPVTHSLIHPSSPFIISADGWIAPIAEATRTTLRFPRYSTGVLPVIIGVAAIKVKPCAPLCHRDGMWYQVLVHSSRYRHYRCQLERSDSEGIPPPRWE